MRRIREALQKKRYDQQQRRFNAIYPYLSHAQLAELDAHAAMLENRRPRRWWMLYTPEPEPPQLGPSLWHWSHIMALFIILNLALSAAVVTGGLRGYLPQAALLPVYLVLAIPVAVLCLANLAALLHVPRKITARA